MNKKAFIRFAWLFLLATLIVMMLQNYIRYGIHEGYQPLRSLVYLLISILLFAPVVPIILYIGDKMKMYAQPPAVYVAQSLLISGLSIGLFFFLSHAILYLLGYYDSFIDPTYLRYYFGREVLIHLLVMGAIFIYIKQSKSTRESEKILSGSLGRKKVHIPARSILWIEADDHYLRLHTEDMTLLKRGSLKEMAASLAPDFVQIHRKYLVNQAVIKAYLKENRVEYVLLSNQQKLRISKSFSHQFGERSTHDT